MKKKALLKLLLLEQSGELSARQLCRLNRELVTSEDARILRNELRDLKGFTILPGLEPSPWIVARIVARLRQEPDPGLNIYKLWKPALALAAGLIVFIEILNFHDEQTSSTPVVAVMAAVTAGVDVWNDPIEEDLSKLENLIAAISDTPLDIMEM